jgi:hypothetical protein
VTCDRSVLSSESNSAQKIAPFDSILGVQMNILTILFKKVFFPNTKRLRKKTQKQFFFIVFLFAKKRFFYFYGNNNHLIDLKKCTSIQFHVLISNLMSNLTCHMSY